MKIWGDIPKVSGVYGSANKIDKPSKVGEVASKKDELTISGVAKDFNAVMKALRQVPDVREDKVRDITQRMERGEYSVKPSEVADRIVDVLNKNKI